MAQQPRRIDPKTILINGAKILEQVLGPHGFEFRFQSEGQSSGGLFACGQFVRGDRALELHFRYSLEHFPKWCRLNLARLCGE